MLYNILPNFPSTIEMARTTSMDSCRAAYELMRQCLNNTGRPIVYAINENCEINSGENPLPWVKDVANMHCTSDDIKDNWDRMLYCLETTADL